MRQSHKRSASGGNCEHHPHDEGGREGLAGYYKASDLCQGYCACGRPTPADATPGSTMERGPHRGLAPFLTGWCVADLAAGHRKEVRLVVVVACGEGREVGRGRHLAKAGGLIARDTLTPLNFSEKIGMRWIELYFFGVLAWVNERPVRCPCS